MKIKHLATALFCLFLGLWTPIFSGVHQLHKIYDCFIFCDELEVLEIRLAELNETVDYFVLVEANETFSGTPKPMYFAENKERFARYLDKIIYVPVKEQLSVGSSTLDREYFQRRQIAQGLTRCHNGDIVMVSNVDEIPKAERFHDLIQPIVDLRNEVVVAAMNLYRFYLNRRDTSSTSSATTAVTSYWFFKKIGPNILRELRNDRQFPVIENAGWHFSAMGGRDPIPQDLQECQLIQIDHSYPKYVREHFLELLQKGYIDPATIATPRAKA